MSISTLQEPDPTRQRLRRLGAQAASYALVIVTLLVLAAVLGLLFSGQDQAARWLGSVYALAVGAYIALGMVRELLRGTWGIDVLALMAIVSTVAVGEYVAAVLVVVMVTGGESLERYAAGRAGRELRALLERAPQRAHRLDPATRVPQDVSIDQVSPGDQLLVLPAEVLPVDARLVTAEATLDESSLTGESLPVTRSAGDAVLSGSVNGGSAIEVVATARAQDSQYQRIVALVAAAQERRAPSCGWRTATRSRSPRCRC